jgi:polyhydroxyalkanoate synthesis regulator phasin
MKSRIVLSLLLVISLLLSSLVVSAEPTGVREFQGNPFEREFTGTERVEQQINTLVESGAISQKQAKSLVKEYQPKILQQYSEIRTLDKGAYLVGLNTETNETIDPEQYIQQQKSQELLKSNNIQPQASLAWYIVHFYFLIGNPGTNNADLVHTGTVTGCLGFGCPDDYTAILRLKASASKGGYVYDTITETTTVDLLEDAELVEDIADTAYWHWDSIVYANESGGQVPASTGIGSPELINKKGRDYPLGYSDPQSGIVLYEPPTILSVNQQVRDNQFKSKFETHYENNWGSPTEFSWSQVDIHHMRPLKYGGSNAMSNGIPLMNFSSSHSVIPKHSYLTSWWASY